MCLAMMERLNIRVLLIKQNTVQPLKDTGKSFLTLRVTVQNELT